MELGTDEHHWVEPVEIKTERLTQSLGKELFSE